MDILRLQVYYDRKELVWKRAYGEIKESTNATFDGTSSRLLYLPDHTSTFLSKVVSCDVTVFFCHAWAGPASAGAASDVAGFDSVFGSDGLSNIRFVCDKNLALATVRNVEIPLELFVSNRIIFVYYFVFNERLIWKQKQSSSSS